MENSGIPVELVGRVGKISLVPSKITEEKDHTIEKRGILAAPSLQDVYSLYIEHMKREIHRKKEDWRPSHTSSLIEVPHPFWGPIEPFYSSTWEKIKPPDHPRESNHQLGENHSNEDDTKKEHHDIWSARKCHFSVSSTSLHCENCMRSWHLCNKCTNCYHQSQVLCQRDRNSSVEVSEKFRGTSPLLLPKNVNSTSFSWDEKPFDFLYSAKSIPSFTIEEKLKARSAEILNSSRFKVEKIKEEEKLGTMGSKKNQSQGSVVDQVGESRNISCMRLPSRKSLVKGVKKEPDGKANVDKLLKKEFYDSESTLEKSYKLIKQFEPQANSYPEVMSMKENYSNQILAWHDKENVRVEKCNSMHLLIGNSGEKVCRELPMCYFDKKRRKEDERAIILLRTIPRTISPPLVESLVLLQLELKRDQAYKQANLGSIEVSKLSFPAKPSPSSVALIPHNKDLRITGRLWITTFKRYFEILIGSVCDGSENDVFQSSLTQTMRKNSDLCLSLMESIISLALTYSKAPLLSINISPESPRLNEDMNKLS